MSVKILTLIGAARSTSCPLVILQLFAGLLQSDLFGTQNAFKDLRMRWAFSSALRDSESQINTTWTNNERSELCLDKHSPHTLLMAARIRAVHESHLKHAYIREGGSTCHR